MTIVMENCEVIENGGLGDIEAILMPDELLYILVIQWDEFADERNRRVKLETLPLFRTLKL